MAYGFGAAKQIAVDPDTHMLYTVSEQGWVSVADIAAAATTGAVFKSAFQVPGLGALTDVEVCTGAHGSFLFVSASAVKKTDAGSVSVYQALSAGSADAPTLLRTIAVGALPDMVLPNAMCTLLAVANEGEGDYSDALVDPVGSVSFVDLSDLSVTTVALDMGMSDAEMISAGIHLPLSLDAMEYFDDHSAAFSAGLDFTAARAAYTPATQLEPEYLAWSSDGATLYVGLQENSAVATVDVASRSATKLTALGLKSWSQVGIDTVKDSKCVLETKPGYATLRLPDAIAAFNVNGIEYVITANDGGDVGYGAFGESQRFKDLITGASPTAFGPDFAEFIDPNLVVNDPFALFGDSELAVTLGSSGVDYSTPTAPKMRAAVGFGGRGVSVYSAADMALVWDSGSDFEEAQCAAYPWAHNSIQDEDYALNRFPGGFLYAASAGTDVEAAIAKVNMDGCADAGDGKMGACPLSGTVDAQSQKDGANPESMVVGVACGRLVAVTSTEKSGTAFFYDVTVPTAPELLFVKHLTPASETLSAEIAYTWRLLGDVDAESVVFLDAEHSPSGKAAVVFAGALSGTVSYYEFTCAADAVDEPFELDILHVNDHHSHLAGDKFMLKTFGIVPGAAASAAVSVEYGGYARLVPLFAELEKSGNVLKLHAGDAITGTSYYSLFQGAADATAMAEVCFDAFALGNHEFDGGDAPLADFLDELQVAETKFGCPVTTKVLAANVHPGADSPLVGKIHNSTVFTVGGQRIGVVGVDIKGKTMMSSSPSPGTKLSDELMAAQFNINALIADGVDKIVLLSHIGFGMDAMLAPELSGVDVIIGGDSHSMLGGTAAAMIKQPEAAYPYQLLNKDGDPVCIGQAWEYAHVLGHMKVSFDAKGVVVKCGGDVAVPVNIQSNYANAASVPAGSPAVPPLDAAGAAAVNAFFASRQIFHPVLADASTTAALADYTAQIKILSANVIATVPAKICLDRFPGEGRGGCDASQTQARGGAVGNLVATGFLHNAPVADIAIQNGGGCRVSIVAGDFTFNDAYTLLPFANTLINIEMTGAQIKQVLEDTLTNTLDMGGSTGGYPYAAGIRFHVDASAVANSRISYLEVNSRLAGTWAAIDAAKKYTVVTNSYTAGGKDGYVTFGLIPAAKKVDTYIEYAQSMVNYAEAVGTLVAPSAADFSTQQYTDKLGIWHGSTEAPAPVPTAAPSPAPTPMPQSSGAAAAAAASLLAVAAAALLF